MLTVHAMKQMQRQGLEQLQCGLAGLLPFHPRCQHTDCLLLQR